MGRKAIARNPSNEPAHATLRLWNMPVAKRAEQKLAKHIWRQADSSYHVRNPALKNDRRKVFAAIADAATIKYASIR